jgi:proteic killer suppression protein
LEVTFDDRSLGEMCESDRELRKMYGLVRAKKIQMRITALRAAETLEDMRFLPGHCHELKGDLAGQLALDLDQPYRLLFRPKERPDPGHGGGLDWRLVIAVVVTTIVDYH